MAVLPVHHTRRLRAAAAIVLVLSALRPVPSVAQDRPVSDSARAVHLLNRATFGARPQDIGAVLSGREAWLERQLHPERVPDTTSRSISRRYPSTTLPMRELYAADAAARTLLLDLASARLERAIVTDRQLEEVMTEFWFNHFNVFFQKGADRYLVADYERSAIRPHVFGRFEDMLVATAKHPAMLFYLDNWQSVHVDSSRMRAMARPGQRPARGLNENYARELLELHTLGVDGGYTQTDVINVARALTGWSFNQPRGAMAQRTNVDVGFAFRPQLHDRNEKTVLGNRLPAGRGIEDGEQVLHILAGHPATARFISGKLVSYFVSDTPQPVLVERLARIFADTDGDLRAVTRALFTDPQFYAPQNVRSKVKTPFRLVVSAARATGSELTNSRGLLQVLRTMGQMSYMASEPTGYPAASADWVNSGAMLARMNFGIDYAGGKVPGVRLSARNLVSGATDADRAFQSAAAALLPGVDAAPLQRAIAADPAEGSPRDKLLRMYGLVLGSPEFQRH